MKFFKKGTTMLFLAAGFAMNQKSIAFLVLTDDFPCSVLFRIRAKINTYARLAALVGRNVQ